MDNSRDTSRSSNNQSSSQHYSTLLSTVSELRTDLERTLNKIHSLEDQNRTLTNNYQTIKDELIETRKKYNEVKETYMQTVSEKFEAEEKYEAVISNVQSQLTEKSKEFEIVRDKLIPHDVDQLRIKVQEELEIQHRQQLQSVEQELERQREQYYIVRRELERSKAENEIVVQHLQHEIVSIRSEREEVESHLRREVSKLKEVEYASVASKQDFVKVFKAKATELSFTVETVKKEALSLRVERDELLDRCDKNRSAFEIESTQLRAQLAMAVAEKLALEEQLLRCNIEADRKEAVTASYRRTIEENNERIGKTLSDLRVSEKNNNVLRDDGAKQVELLSAMHEAERNELQESIDSLKDCLNERETILRKAQREASEMQLRAESVEGELRRTHLLQLQDFRKRLSMQELQLAEAHSSLKLNETQANQLLSQSNFERDGLRSEVARLKREKDILQVNLRDLEALLDGERKKLSSVQQELGAKLSASEAKARELEVTSAAAERKLRETSDRQLEAQSALLLARESSTLLERRNMEQLAQLEATKKEFQHQLDLLMPSYREKFENMQSTLKGDLAKERKRADAYKLKALEAHSRVKAVSGGLDLYNSGPVDM